MRRPSARALRARRGPRAPAGCTLERDGDGVGASTGSLLAHLVLVGAGAFVSRVVRVGAVVLGRTDDLSVAQEVEVGAADPGPGEFDLVGAFDALALRVEDDVLHGRRDAVELAHDGERVAYAALDVLVV